MLGAPAAQAADALPSWNKGASKQAITAFVSKVTKAGSPDYVPVSRRIATFDNDGTLWAEQPLYFQFLFVIDRIKALGAVSVRKMDGIQETIKFPLPKGLKADGGGDASN
jgi:hypothetical protein